MTGDDDVIVEYVKKGTAFAIPKWALNLPEWVPPYLADFFRLTWARELVDPVRGPILKRLLTDSRMKPFYEYLTAKRKRDDRHKLPACFPRPDQYPDPSKRQNHAIGQIILTALCLAADKPKVILQAEVDAIRKERQELARKVQELADELADEKKSTRSKVLYAAVDVVEQMVSETGKGWIVAERDRKEPAQAFAILMGLQFDRTFGSPCYRLCATITSVALNCDVPWTRVRDWWDPEDHGWAYRSSGEE